MNDEITNRYTAKQTHEYIITLVRFVIDFDHGNVARQQKPEDIVLLMLMWRQSAEFTGKYGQISAAKR